MPPEPHPATQPPRASCLPTPSLTHAHPPTHPPTHHSTTRPRSSLTPLDLRTATIITSDRVPRPHRGTRRSAPVSAALYSYMPQSHCSSSLTMALHEQQVQVLCEDQRVWVAVAQRLLAHLHSHLEQQPRRLQLANHTLCFAASAVASSCWPALRSSLTR
jgi:GH24 family phage-related lysozyme (muramidase)